MCRERSQMVMVRFLAEHINPSEATDMKDVTLVGLRSGTGKTLTKQSELEQLDHEAKRVLHFGGWISECSV